MFVVSKSELIRMKTGAGRSKDNMDVAALSGLGDWNER